VVQKARGKVQAETPQQEQVVQKGRSRDTVRREDPPQNNDS
jgi:hypothetical protein